MSVSEPILWVSLSMTCLVPLWWGAQGEPRGPTGPPRSPSRPSYVYVCLSFCLCACVVHSNLRRSFDALKGAAHGLEQQPSKTYVQVRQNLQSARNSTRFT